METIQKEIWYATGKYDRDPNVPNLMPSIDYDYGAFYVMILGIFGIGGSIIVGINLLICGRRK